MEVHELVRVTNARKIRGFERSIFRDADDGELLELYRCKKCRYWEGVRERIREDGSIEPYRFAAHLL